MKKLLLALALLITASAAQAQITANVAVASDYRFRGVSQTQNGPALQGGFDYAHSSGFYVGNWNSSVSNVVYPDSTGVEMDAYAGYRTTIKGFAVDVGSMNYFYSQAAGRFNSNANTNEGYIAVGKGPVTVKYSRSFGDYFGTRNSQGSEYVQADLALPVVKNITAEAHVGRTMIANAGNNDYTDMRVGAVWTVEKFRVGAHYYATTGEGRTFRASNTLAGQALYKESVVVSVARSF